MGYVYTEATFAGPSGSFRVQALVDTGAIYSVISPQVAERLGLRPAETVTIQTPGGKTAEAGVAIARVTVAGRTAPVAVLILEGQEPPLIGAETLEVLGFRVDPTAQPPRIEPTRSFTLGVF